MAIITLTTDFGEGSPYVAQMKGVILSINPSATLVDLTHAIPAQDILAGARTLACMTSTFTSETIHVAVVDPGVGSKRGIIYLENASGRFIGPDNGLLSCLAGSQQARKMVAIENPQHWLPEVSRTFHGRDIMAPVAARLSLGLDPTELGPTQEALVTLDQNKAHRVGQRIEGEIVEVDSFGNLITNITRVMLDGAPTDVSLSVQCDGHETQGLFQTYSDQPEMTLVALVGSSEVLEIAIVNESAAAMLGITVGTPVAVNW